MNCPACGHENPDRARFCGECARPLADATACPSCGAENPSGQKFCNQCAHPLRAASKAPSRDRVPRDYTPRHLAEKILGSKSALEGERKQVTVLFADVKGSLELAEQVDPEEWHRILDRFLQILADGVHRFEGTVNQYTGDGIMALFGAPIAHEDHAQRACYAALRSRELLRAYADELRLSRGLDLAVRMGINSGEVVVGKIGDDLRMDYTAQGHTVGLAARMEEIAGADRICLTAETRRLVEGLFRLRDLGPTALRGASELVRVFELEEASELRTRFEAARARGLSRFVGRDGELATLEASLERSFERGGLVVGVVADAGTGKSRLCYEFAGRCRARGIPVLEARGVAHGKQIPMLPMLELFRSFFGITDRDPDRLAREKIAGRILLLDDALRDDLPLVFELLGVPDPERPAPPMDPEAVQRRSFGALRRIVRADGEREPGVTLIEDLHWLDPVSDALLEQLIEAIAATRSLVLVNFRPEYRAGWMKKSHYQQLALTPLGPEALRELLGELLGPDPSLGELVELVAQRGGGNPFFTEEIVQDLAESGALEGVKGAYRLLRPVAELSVPPTVQAVLAARIDRLPEREKRVLETAAVIGKSVPEPLLSSVAQLPERDLAEALRSLLDAELLYEESLYPQVAYAFKHPLTQEVAYGSQLRERRARVHAAVARQMEALDERRLDERAAHLAHHWEGAGEPVEAARWHARAADWIGWSDYGEAFSHWRRVCDLVREAPDAEEVIELKTRCYALLLSLAFRVTMPESEAARIFDEGRAFLERQGDPAPLARLLLGYASLKENAGALSEYLEFANQAGAFAEQTGEPGLRAAVRFDQGWALHTLGRLSEIPALAESGLALVGDDIELGAEVVGFSPYIVLNMLHSLWLVERGHLGEAERRLDRVLPLARAHGSPETLLWTHATRGYLADAKGDATLAMDAARDALGIVERVGSAQALPIALYLQGIAYILLDRWEEAVEALESGLEAARTRRVFLEFQPMYLSSLALAHQGAGDSKRALALCDEATTLARHAGALLQLCIALLRGAQLVRETEGEPAAGRVEALLSEAQQLIEQTGAVVRRPRIHLERAGLAALRRQGDLRESELREAHRLFVEVGATGHAERLAKELGP